MAMSSLAKLAKQVKKEVEIEDKHIQLQFTDEIDKFLVADRVAKRELRNQNRRIAFQPSSYYNCQRDVWYKLMGFTLKGTPTPISERWTEVGSSLHTWIQDELIAPMSKTNGYKIKTFKPNELKAYTAEGIEFIAEHVNSDIEAKFVDYRFTKVLPISAMVDGLLNFKGQDMIFEFKTSKSEKYQPLIMPMKDHIKQGLMYSLCLDRLPVMFMYLDKNTQDWKSFFIEYNEAQYDWIIRRLSRIEQYYVDKELPPKEESEENCKYCKYKTFCKNEVCTEGGVVIE